MTLVVAQLNRSGVISAVCDTGITEHSVHLPPERQLPKICILTPDVAVGFAGSRDLAQRYLDAFTEPKGNTYHAVTSYFLKCHRDSAISGGEMFSVDFIVMLNKPSPKLVIMREGRARQVNVAWIGDKSGYEAFQRLRLTRAPGSHVSQFEDFELATSEKSEGKANETFHMLAAMRFVTLDPSCPDVFGFVVAMNNIDGAFQYRPYAPILRPKLPSLALPRSLVERISPELKELQSYAMSCFTAGPESQSLGVAFHFAQAKLTYFFSAPVGRALQFAQTVQGMNMEEFISATKEKYGINWRGLLALQTPPSAEYGIPLNRWRRERR